MATDLEQRKTSPGKFDMLVAAQLGRAEGRIRALDLTVGGLGLLVGLLAYTILMVLADHFLDLSVSTRRVLLFVGGLGAVLYLWWGILKPLRGRLNPYYAAREVERTLSGAKNSVINWVDLHNDPLPPGIRGAVGRRAAKDVQQADIEEAISARRAAWTGVGTAVLGVALVALLLILGPQSFFYRVARAFSPFGLLGGPPASTQITVLRPEGGNTTVTIGRALRIVVRVDGQVPDPEGENPLKLLYRYHQAEPYLERLLQPEMGRDWEWATTVPALDVRSGFWYKVVGGDGQTPEYRVDVRSTPQITDFQATYHYRPYVAHIDEIRYDRKLKALRGTEVTLKVRTNRVLAEGRMEFMGKEKVSDLRAKPLPEDAQTFHLRFVLDEPGNYRLSFQSAEGESYTDLTHHAVEVIDDLPPKVELTHPGEDIELPANGLLQLEGKASDDLGVASLAQRARIEGGPELQRQTYRPEGLRLENGSYPLEVDYKDFVDLSQVKTAQGKPWALQPGMVMEYWLEAADACDYPDAHRVESQRFRVRIIEPEKDEQRRQEERDQAAQEQARHQQEQDQKRKEESEARQREQEELAKRQQEEARQREEQRQQQEGKKGGAEEEKKGNKGEGKGEASSEKSPQEPGEKKEASSEGTEGNQGTKGEERSAEQQKRDQELAEKIDRLNKSIKNKERQEKQKSQGKGDPDKPAEAKDGGQGQEGQENSQPERNQEGKGKGAGKQDTRQESSQGKEQGKPQEGMEPGEGKESGKEAGRQDRGTPKGGKPGSGEEQAASGKERGESSTEKPRGSAGQEGGQEGRSASKPEPGGAGKSQAGQGKPAGQEPGSREAQASAGKPAGSKGEQPADGQAQGTSRGRPEATQKAEGKGTSPERMANREQQGVAKEDSASSMAERLSRAQQKPAGDRSGAEQVARGEPKSGGDKEEGSATPDPRAQGANPEDVERLVRKMKSGDEQDQKEAGEQLERIARQARDPQAREAAERELEKLEREQTRQQLARGKQPPKPSNPSDPEQKSGAPCSQCKGGGKGSSSSSAGQGKSSGKPGTGRQEPGQGQGQGKGKGAGQRPGEQPGANPTQPPQEGGEPGTAVAKGLGRSAGGDIPGTGGVRGERGPGERRTVPGAPTPERPFPPEAHRATQLQLERFKDKVDKDILKDARMSPEEYARFLASLKQRAQMQEAEARAQESLPGAKFGGPLPSSRGRSPGARSEGAPEDVIGSGRALPPPGYRDAYREFLRKVAEKD
jgi:hypothetical protein